MSAYGSAWQGCSKCHSRTPCKCLQDTPRAAALKADAERLAELREEFLACYATERDVHRVTRLVALISVYEECAARGIAFGGGR